MCGGGKKTESAQSAYERRKPKTPRPPLPSLSMNPNEIIKRDGQSYGSVRTGKSRRSLLGRF